MSTVTAELKFVSPQYFADVVKAKDAEIERWRSMVRELVEYEWGSVEKPRTGLSERSPWRRAATMLVGSLSEGNEP
jgi:hypothetical protein